jgi:galactose mutarotase-like enzyme
MHAMTTDAPAVTRGACEGFGTVELAAGELRAAFAPSAGMAGVSLRHAGEELLDRRDGVAAYAERGAVMGLPILHPWANRLAGFEYAVEGRWVRLPGGPPLVRCEEHGLPIHGLLGGSRHWRVRAATTAGGQACLSADLAFDDRQPDLLAAFPFPHTLSLDAALDPAGLTVTTTIAATGDAPVPVAFGFHPYLTLPGVERSRWGVELPARRYLFTDARGIPTGHHEDERATRLRLGARSFDDGFEAVPDGAEFAVSGGGRRIAVSFLQGYPAAQVFSPPEAPFICFEPMTAPTNVLRSGHGLRCVRPGDEFRAAFRIGVAG